LEHDTLGGSSEVSPPPEMVNVENNNMHISIITFNILPLSKLTPSIFTLGIRILGKKTLSIARLRAFVLKFCIGCTPGHKPENKY
jgi:hypothetical protein